MKKEDIKNEIENFIIYHCGSNDEQLTHLLTCLDAYIDNDHIINDEELEEENKNLRELVLALQKKLYPIK